MNKIKDAAGLVEMIRDLIDTKLSQIDTTATCLIQAVNEDGTLNVSILPDTQTILQNIINESKYTFQPGDYALLYMISNRPSNSFVICKYNPNRSDVGWQNDVNNLDAQIDSLGKDLTDSVNTLSERIDQIGVISAPVTSVNGRTGAVVGLAEENAIPTNTSDLINDLLIGTLNRPVYQKSGGSNKDIALTEDIPTFEVNDGVLTIHVPDGTLTV